MANYNDLITAIDSVIKTNNRREITGQLLQNVLNTMVGSLGENYQLAGFATPTTNPHQPDQNVFYVASQAGVYTQFDNIVLGDGISFLMWKNGAWTSQTISNVTQSWVQQNFVSKEWFRKVFRVYDEDGLEIVPNDMDSVVDNIKAMVGLWTNEYLSALGMGRDGGGSTQTLAQLNDVQLGTLVNGDALVYNTAIHKWENKQIQTGVDMSVVWAALAANTNEQINASHLATALSSYVTSANLSTMLNDYATKAWAGQNFITVEWFDKLFKLYNGAESDANKIAPNGTLPSDPANLNIEAMFGFWTKKYISALGNGDDGSTSYTTLAQLNDVSLSNPTANQVLSYNGTHWVNKSIELGSQTLADLTDVVITSPAANQMLGYDATNQKWINVNVPETYTLPPASADTLGGIKVGTTLSISSGVLNLPTTSVTAGTYRSVTVDDYGRVTGGTNPTTVSGYGITDAITTANIGSQSVNYATSAGNVTWANVSNKPNVAIQESDNNLIAHSNEFNFVGSGYNDVVWFNYRTAGGTNGSISEYWLGNGAGGTLGSIIHSGNIGSQSVSYATSAGSASSAGNADTVDGYHESAFLHKSGGTMTGDITIGNSTFYASGSNGGVNSLALADDCILGDCNIGGHLGLKSLNTNYAGIAFYNSSGSYLGRIATTGTFELHDSNDNYATLNVGNLYSTGAVSALSDIRHKEIVRNTNLQVEQIAAMRSVIYRKKDSNDNTLYAGSIAQDWQSILPQVVSVADNDEHTQSLQYGVAALIAVITTARKVAEHEQKIKEQAQKISELEQVCSFLKNENKELKDLVNNLNVV